MGNRDNMTVRQYPMYENSLESMPREELTSLQLVRLKSTIKAAFRNPFYSEKLRKAGIETPADIKTLSDVLRIPFTTKDDLRSAFPVDHLSVPHKEVVRLHSSSGTTGKPTVIYHTRTDLMHWTELVSRSLVAVGCTEEDIFQNMMTYGLFTGGLGLHYGAENLGMMVIPVSSGNTERQVKLMQDFNTTVLHATPSYLLHIHSYCKANNIDVKSLPLRRAVIGAEPHSEDIRKKIENLYDIDVYNCYGLSELNGPGVAFECLEKHDMHVWEDSYIAEIIDPETEEPLPDGEEGELVLTSLGRAAVPLLRYRTRDLTSINPELCKCGRTHRRIRRIKGRTDDMMIINGVNVYPSQIEEVLMRFSEIGTNYRIEIEKKGALDLCIIKTEVNASVFSDDARNLNALRERIQERVKSAVFIHPRVELHEPGVLPVSVGKAVRVVDNR